MPISEKEKQKKKPLYERAITLYKEGYSYRAVGKKLDRSATWVMLAIRKNNQPIINEQQRKIP
jgi:hypothetical protein